MSIEFVASLIRQALMTVLTAAAPVLIAGLGVGLSVSIFQAVSQIHEMTLTFIPKIVVIFVTLMIFGPWIMKVVLNFAIEVFSNLGKYAHM